MNKVLRKIDYVMSWLDCSRPHVLREIASGRLKAINIGRGKSRSEWRISDEAVDEYIAALSIPASKYTPTASAWKSNPNSTQDGHPVA